MPWYVVFHGKEPGVFHQWSDCQKQISGFRDNCYKRYETKDEAIMAFSAYMKDCTCEKRLSMGVASRRPRF